jgi:hypothetical protein
VRDDDQLAGIIAACGQTLTHVDFLGCATLRHPAWVAYYEKLQEAYPALAVGASDDDTGNLKSGGDWVMETTGEDVHAVYFGEAMARYSGLLSYRTPDIRNYYAFAALRSDGRVVCWGHDGYGGDCSKVESDLRRGVVMIYTSPYAFAALKADGSVVCWGDSGYGGSVGTVDAS